MMEWIYYVSYFFGGVFLANAVPHFVSGVMGRPFQSPFAKPPGQGLSSSTVNVLWGFLNLVVAYVLLCRVGNFDLRSTAHVVVSGLGVLLISMMGHAASDGFMVAMLLVHSPQSGPQNKKVFMPICVFSGVDSYATNSFW